MILSDFHTHTYYCDGKASPEEMLLSAIEKGFRSYGFSSHSYAPYDKPYCLEGENEEKYRADAAMLKEKYKDVIKVYCGVEQDMFAPLQSKPFDYRIGSVHYIIVNGEYFTIDWGKERQKHIADEHFGGDYLSLAEAYFETVAGVYRMTGCDIIGHFDIISKYNEGHKLFDETDPRYVRAWKAAADELLKEDVYFEINVGAVCRGYRTWPYPSLDIMRYLRDNGGRFILSSDAHRPEAVGFQFDLWEKRLAQEGITVLEFDPENKNRLTFKA